MKEARLGLNQTQLAALERDARDMIGSHGPKARAAVLAKAAAFGRRYHTEAAWLSRVAGCIGELQLSAGFDIQKDLLPGVAPSQPSNLKTQSTSMGRQRMRLTPS